MNNKDLPFWNLPEECFKQNFVNYIKYQQQSNKLETEWIDNTGIHMKKNNKS